MSDLSEVIHSAVSDRLVELVDGCSSCPHAKICNDSNIPKYCDAIIEAAILGNKSWEVTVIEDDKYKVIGLSAL